MNKILLKNILEIKQTFKESPPDQISVSDQKQKTVNDVFFHEDPEINSSLRKIYNQDENFESKEFLDGSKKAFEYIIKNYSEENLEPLKKSSLKINIQ